MSYVVPDGTALDKAPRGCRAGGGQRPARGRGHPAHAPRDRAHERRGSLRVRAAHRDGGDGVGGLEGGAEGVRREAHARTSSGSSAPPMASTPHARARRRGRRAPTARRSVRGGRGARAHGARLGTRGRGCRCTSAARTGGRGLCPAGHVALSRPGSTPRRALRRDRAHARRGPRGAAADRVHRVRASPIAAGELDVALVCGGEAKYRDLAPASPDTRSPTRSSPTAPHPTSGWCPNTRSCRSSSATRGWSTHRGSTPCSRRRCAPRGVNRWPRTRARPGSCGRPSAASRRRIPTRGDGTR